MKLNQLHFFKNFSAPLRQELLTKGELKNFKAGEMIFRAKDTDTDFYVLAEGRIQVYKFSKGGQKRILRTVQPGDTFALVSLFDEKPMFITAEVLGEEAKVFVIEREQFHELLHKYYELARFVIDGLVRRIRRYGEAFATMTVYYLDQRFISYLFDLADPNLSNNTNKKAELRLPDTVKTIAEQLGTSREVLSREIGKMVKKGWIEKEGQLIKVKNARAMKQRLQEE